MQKIKWIIGLSLAGVLAVSGAAYALGYNSNTNAFHSPTTANSTVSSSPDGYGPGSMEPYSGNSSYSGYGMMGGYSGNGSYGGYGMMDGYSGNSGNGGYGMMGGYRR